ncbi:hypothetical protein [Aeromonas sp. S9(2024)]|uniref:hypothetical protein n=1 Tax=Aeromonas sp. S9(2024) TaxID=3242882 RepID=UPI003528C21E
MDMALLTGTVGVPLMIAVLNFVVRYLGKLGISPSSDLLLVLLCLDMANLVSMDFFAKAVQSDFVKANLQPVVMLLAFSTLILWIVNIWGIERKYQDCVATSSHGSAPLPWQVDCKKMLLLGASFLLSVLVFGVHIFAILYKSVGG